MAPGCCKGDGNIATDRGVLITWTLYVNGTKCGTQYVLKD